MVKKEGTTSTLIPRAITSAEFTHILKADAEIYPTSNPLTLEVLSEWYSIHPEFGLIYTQPEEPSSICGSCCVVALNKTGWEKLIKGHISEADIGRHELFDNSKHDSVYLHIYHAEVDKPVWTSFNHERFGIALLKGIEMVLEKLRKSNPALSVGGFSGK